MFESLSERLSGVFRAFGAKQLTEDNIQEALREVRLALLEADVNFSVVKDFVEKVRVGCVGQEVGKKLTPGQQVIKVVHEELTALLGGASQGLKLVGPPPSVLMLVGLQGSGKTTTAGKLANLLRKQKMRPYLVPADVHRPAAILQLQTLAKQLDIPCFDTKADMAPATIAAQAVEAAKAAGCNLVIVDTAGRLHIDEPLMQELKDITRAVNPQEIFFVADAMTGQNAVSVAESFNSYVPLTGVVLTKMDGDARGGAALSIKAITGATVRYVGIGEQLSDLEDFYPERVAGRILGMGDMLTLIEKAQAGVDEEEAKALAKKMEKAKFDLEDFRVQMRRMRQMGSLESIMKMIPGLGALAGKLGDMNVPEKELSRTDAIINSMTMKERRNPELLNGSRKLRVAKGSGTSINEVNMLLKKFDQMRLMMQQMMQGGGKKTAMPQGGMGGLGGMGALGGLGGMGGMPGMGAMPGMPGLPGGMGQSKGSATKKKRDVQKERAKRKNKKR